MDNTLDDAGAPRTPTKAAEPNDVEEPEQGKEETYIAGDMLAPRNAQVVRALADWNKFAVGEEVGEPNETKDCVLCGGICELYGNNPHPLANEGRCCDDCNLNKVVPARLAWMERYGDGFTPYFDPAAVTGTV